MVNTRLKQMSAAGERSQLQYLKYLLYSFAAFVYFLKMFLHAQAGHSVSKLYKINSIIIYIIIYTATVMEHKNLII